MEAMHDLKEIVARIPRDHSAQSLKIDVCPKCGGSGYIFSEKDGYRYASECECEKRRKTLARIDRSGMAPLIEACTFDSYDAKTEWQRQVKQAAIKFCDDCADNWFYIGGGAGSGKTHICTAIVGELINRGMIAKYMVWRTDARKLKSIVNDSDEYDRAMSQFDSVKVLYIDDFLKTKAGEHPSTGDINLAFELLNYRYVNTGLVTIISSERTIEEIIEIDPGLGSRIRQRAKNYSFTVRGKNYRLM